MTTKARYVLLPLGDRSDTVDDPAPGRFPTIRRTGWKARIRVPRVDTDVQVKIQGSAWGTEDADWEDLYDATYSSTVDETVGGGEAGDPSWATAPDESHAWIRAIVPSHTDLYVVEVEAWAPLADWEETDGSGDPAGDQLLLSEELRDWDEKSTIMDRAERIVLSKAIGQGTQGRLQADSQEALTRPEALAVLKEAVAEQAELEFLRARLQESDEPSSLYMASGARLPKFADQLGEILEPILDAETNLVVRHR